ncbi:L-threonylcarbamoyladenylate synthase [Robertmurraya sp. DFI.2.37]|jgi:L-threonylcarbamoyladenylate synthase|uniref:L-threonylcarbamoyladenylate synthase n=1 Tax=Robertmurraya sp. DFI.2.37 TaxID=3031819 RepID=UPI001246594B|nr:L-threonylcarbamoyladenylate synthase [Robertmurraya sp. DFI.2.37]MDF1508224.1 L-threonylcarbamoyladenylate synthase [Robertmurraya sp. DFI.2.37]
MDTSYFKVDKNVDNLSTYPQIIEAADRLVKNEVVAFPTETVYGLGGNAKSDAAVRKIFAAKGRPSDNPLIIHISELQQIKEFVVEVPQTAELLMEKFWPGPLTIIFQKKAGVLSELATAGLSTVAIRMPEHPVALALIQASGLPIAAPSANRSGRPSPTTAEHVWEDLNGKVSAIVDGGSTGIGVESTVLDCTGDIPQILRPGGVTKEQLEAEIGLVKVDPALASQDKAPKSPGMKYTHYAPDAPLYLVKGSREYIQQLIFEKKREGLKVGVLTTVENRDYYESDIVQVCGQRSRLETVASGLYDALRSFNKSDVNIIFSEAFVHEGVGEAIMNRLLKAAGHKVITEN